MPYGLRVPGGGGAARAAGRWCGAGRGRAKPGHGGRWHSRWARACADRLRRASQAVFHFQVIIVLDFSADVNFD